ncbi:hypothetical protein N752_27330 [Desulforamulus aquiferis]|nr:hypothetical protein N752_27330 [Desulforamulus aquiferis]
MVQINLKSIGKVCVDDQGMRLILDKEYIPALTNLEDFSYINVLWWFSKCDNLESRSKLTEKSPYKNSPGILGTFATRSPERPNPIALTTSYVTYIDSQNGIIGLATSTLMTEPLFWILNPTLLVSIDRKSISAKMVPQLAKKRGRIR